MGLSFFSDYAAGAYTFYSPSIRVVTISRLGLYARLFRSQKAEKLNRRVPGTALRRRPVGGGTIGASV